MAAAPLGGVEKEITTLMGSKGQIPMEVFMYARPLAGRRKYPPQVRGLGAELL